MSTEMHYLANHPASKSWFKAKYPGYICVGCGTKIKVGDTILLSQVKLVKPEAKGGYLRAECCRRTSCIVVEREFLKYAEHERVGEEVDDNVYDMDGNIVTEEAS